MKHHTHSVALTPGEAAIAAIVTAAFDWASERAINDWDEAALAKAIANHAGDWPGCAQCDLECDEPCMPHTVAEVHAAIDSRIAQLVHDGRLHAHVDYKPPAGWKPVAMPQIRRRRPRPPTPSVHVAAINQDGSAKGGANK